MLAGHVPTLIQGIDYNQNRVDDGQILERFPDKAFKKCAIVTCESKRGIVLYDLSKRGFEQRITVGEITGKIRKEMVSISVGLLCPYKDKGRGKTAHFFKAMRNLMCDG